jgi:hypothetical protein
MESILLFEINHPEVNLNPNCLALKSEELDDLLLWSLSNLVFHLANTKRRKVNMIREIRDMAGLPKT